MSPFRFQRCEPSSIARDRPGNPDKETLENAGKIIDDVRCRGINGLIEHAVRLGDLQPGEPFIHEQESLRSAFESTPAEQQRLLERTAERIRSFAESQRNSLRDLTVPVPGGTAGHTAQPVRRAGCYAPGGRFPLPSSVLMTAVTARAAGVPEVWVASPRPCGITLAAAHVAGADALLAAGGAQAIAALAFGAGPVPACDAVVGPGNRWVTAAKQLVSSQTSIDLLAGPSELLVLADATADPALVASDLLAQAEHDPEALCFLVALETGLISRVEVEIDRQLEDLPTAATARLAMESARATFVPNPDDAVEVCDALAPEHLEIVAQNAVTLAQRVSNYGALFVGPSCAEVFGDYGIGPNHVLPTGGTARFTGGLSVFHFLRVHSWVRIDSLAGSDEMVDDAAALARLEGLEAHARAAERRRVQVISSVAHETLPR